MNNKRLPICILAAAMAASALLPGCSKAPAEEASIFTEIEAATPAPVATLAPAPTPTPVTLISESNTPRPTRPPTPTPEPTPEPTPAPTPAPAAAPEPQASSSAGRRYNDTPYKDSYTPVTISAATGSASNFTSALIGGGSVSKSVFSQAKITLVNYWSTTWVSCIGEMGRLAELQRQYEGTGVNFLGVCTDVAGNTGSMANTAKSLMDSVNCTYPVMVYNAALTSGISYLPTTRVYDSAGNIIARYTGALNDQEWINIIETLMAQQA